MVKIGWITALGLACLTLAGCSVARSSPDITEARTLLRALKENEQLYQSAIESDRRALANLKERLGRQDASAADVEAAARELDAVKHEFGAVHNRLASLPVGDRLREQLLEPILRQISKEQAELDSLQESLEGEDVAVVRARLEHHPVPQNLFTPAIRKIRESYGFARQRLWRGHPLTA